MKFTTSKSAKVMLVIFMFITSGSLASLKINESFTGVTFPPTGWSKVHVAGVLLTGDWTRSTSGFHSSPACAESPGGVLADNFLITPQFTPDADDSLVFYVSSNYILGAIGRLDIKVSTTNNLPSSFLDFLIPLNISLQLLTPNVYYRVSKSLGAYAGQPIYIAFRHIEVSGIGGGVRVDGVTVNNGFDNDVKTDQNIFPSYEITNSAIPIAPKASFSNIGNLDQSSAFNVTYKISGPVNYSSTKSITLFAGETKTITFDSTFVPNVAGKYSIEIYSSLPNDQDRSNDTILIQSINVASPNYGGGNPGSGGYYFSNSTADAVNAPSQPQLNRKDTTGSTDLILNKVAVAPSLLTGNIDDGYFRLGNIFPSGKHFRFFGVNYDSIFVTTNGVIGLTQTSSNLSSGTPSGIPGADPKPAFYPLWMDFDWGKANHSVGNRLSYKISGSQVIITYDKAPLKGAGPDCYISFQLTIELVGSTIDSRMLCQYSDDTNGMTGQCFIDGYANNTLPPHVIGIQNPGGNNGISYRHDDGTTLISSGPIFDFPLKSLVVEFGTNPNTLDASPSTLNLTLLLEGHLGGGFFSTPRRDRDTVSVSLRSAVSPYNLIETKKIFLDTLGKKTFDYSLVEDNVSYFVVVDHRNSIRTWSKSGGELFTGRQLTYDFTTGINKAFGNNMKLINGVAAIFTGDPVKDGIVDVSDLIMIYNDGLLITTGDYILDDLNWDEIVDAEDIILAYNNSIHVVQEVTP